MTRSRRLASPAHFRLSILVLAAGLVLVGPAPLLAASPEVKIGDSTIRFATRQDGVDLLTADDEFARSLTRFDLQVRLQTTDQTTDQTSVDAWRKSVAEQVLDWSPEEEQNVLASFKDIPAKLDSLRLPLPKEVLLILTTGKEEAGAAYTRANAIILPKAVVQRQRDQLESLLLHELFHVLSRNSRDVRRELYRIIGFELVDPIELPPQLRDRKMTNPDAPGIDCVIRLTVNGEKLTAAPIIYATPAQFDPKHGESLFKYLTVRLLVLEERDGRWQAKMMGDQPVVLDPLKVGSFFEQIGRNTNYIMHPDEILADNFVYLAQKRQNLATPRVTEQMARVLAK